VTAPVPVLTKQPPKGNPWMKEPQPHPILKHDYDCTTEMPTSAGISANTGTSTNASANASVSVGTSASTTTSATKLSSFQSIMRQQEQEQKKKKKQVTIVEPNRKDDMMNTSINMNSNIKNTIIGPKNEIRTKHDVALKHQAKE
jgi:hypothetical protein